MSASSLPEIHSSVATGQLSWWRRMFAFAGPAYLVSVGYMDPGNWASDLEGGARFGYQLIWVLVMANAIAILLQTLSARLGIVRQRDLAQACRETYPRLVSWALWLLCEIAIAACDMAEVLGAAIALNLLFHIPLLTGVLLTSLDTLLILWLTRMGIRLVESFILVMIGTIAVCFVIELWWASPAILPIAGGLVPRLNKESLYVTISILGATVMPHNLYLHSALVQTRQIGSTLEEKRIACRFNFFDCLFALNGALFVNGAILVLAASVFFERHIVVTEIQQAHELLTPLLGATFASVLFGVALLCSGQSSTITGTMAGQIVMEGFLNFRMRPAFRRLVTRLIAIVPASLVVYASGEEGSYKLLLLSQVILNLQLPFAVIPLIRFTSDRQKMGAFANAGWVKLLAWTSAALILALDGWLTAITIHTWVQDSGALKPFLVMCLTVVLGALAALLAWMSFEPWLPGWLRHFGNAPAIVPQTLAEEVTTDLPMPVYRTILVPLDHSPYDRNALVHAVAMAKTHQAKLYLLHVEEDVTSQMYGALASTAEVASGQKYLDQITGSLEFTGMQVEKVVRYSSKPKSEIVRYARELRPDLIVMGAHGHKGIKDMVFGSTINALRHNLRIPLLIVRNPQ